MASLREGWRVWAAMERRLSRVTIQAYERDLIALEKDCGPLQGLSGDALLRWTQGRAGAPATVARRLAALRNYYDYLVRTARRTDDPTRILPQPRVAPPAPRPVRDADSRIAALDEPYRSIAVLIAETGLMISEVVDLRVPSPPPAEVRVVGRRGRTRLLPLTDVARQALERLGGEITVSARSIQRHFRQAGFSPHMLRHTLGSELAKSGADLGEIQNLLGHVSPGYARAYAVYGPPYTTSRLKWALEKRRVRPQPGSETRDRCQVAASVRGH